MDAAPQPARGALPSDSHGRSVDHRLVKQRVGWRGLRAQQIQNQVGRGGPQESLNFCEGCHADGDTPLGASYEYLGPRVV